MAEQIAKTANALRLLQPVFQIFPPTPRILLFLLLLYPFSDSICIPATLVFLAAISIVAMLTQLHLKNAPKFVSLFAGVAAALAVMPEKICQKSAGKKWKRQESAFDCLKLLRRVKLRERIYTHSHAYALC